MIQQQYDAIKKLEKAIKEVRRCGVALAGVDDMLCAFSQAEFDLISRGRAPAEVVKDLEYISFQILDSGAS